MAEYTVDELVTAFRTLGIDSGDVMHVHSALFPLGPMAGATPEQIPERLLEAIQTVIGAQGTVTVAAAFEDYARKGVPYDCRLSPVDRAQGAFSQFLASQPEALRTYCPLAGVAGIGARAQEICHIKTGAAYGVGSAWDSLYQLDAKMCFIGVHPSQAFTFSAYIQFRYGVPHLYNKLYRTPILENGERVDVPITCAVRYLNPAFKIQEDCKPFMALLKQEGLMKSAEIGRGRLYLLPSLREVFDLGTKMLNKNLFYFCAQVPEFTPGEIPTDGPTGDFIPEALRFREST